METKDKRLKKALLALPILILPFLILGFYALGCGKNRGQSEVAKAGINTRLPEAQFTGTDPSDKLSIYQSQRANLKDTAAYASDLDKNNWDHSDMRPGGTEPNEQRINEKLTMISRQIEQPDVPSSKTTTSVPIPSSKDTGMKEDVDRLEQLMHHLQQDKGADPEMTQLSAMLDKIVQIQNPAQGKDKTRLDTSEKQNPFQAIPAVIEGNQKAKQGGVVKLSLVDSVHLNGMVIPKGQLLFGSCSITNQRLLLDIKSIRIGNDIIPVDFSVFSFDGMVGINAPESELAEAAGNGAGNAVQGMQFLSLDQSIATQAAGAGITAAKELLSKKVRRIKVKLKGGAPLLLRNNQLKSN